MLSEPDEAEALLKVVEKYDLSNYIIYDALRSHLASVPPLKAWALAIRFKRDDDRKSAARRWIVGDGRIQDLGELEMVSGRDLAKLITIRQRVIGMLETEIHRISNYWSCAPHVDAHHIQEYTSLMMKQPFNLEGFDFQGLSDAIVETGCSGCLGRFKNPKGLNGRQNIGGFVDIVVTVENA